MSVIWNDVMNNADKANYANTAWHDPADLDTDQADKFMKDQNALALEF